MGAALGNVFAAIWTAIIIRKVCRQQGMGPPLPTAALHHPGTD